MDRRAFLTGIPLAAIGAAVLAEELVFRKMHTWDGAKDWRTFDLSKVDVERIIKRKFKADMGKAVDACMVDNIYYYCLTPVG
jgi:hypothetical protein